VKQIFSPKDTPSVTENRIRPCGSSYMWNSTTGSFNPLLYSIDTYRSCNNRYQFLKDRGVEQVKRNPQRRIWKQIFYKKFFSNLNF
jgi:hypothetical protein